MELQCRLTVPATELDQVIKWCKILVRGAGTVPTCTLCSRQGGVIHLVVQQGRSASALLLAGATVDHGGIPEDGLAVEIEELEEAYAVVAPGSKKEAAGAEIDWRIDRVEVCTEKDGEEGAETRAEYRSELRSTTASAALEMRGTWDQPVIPAEILFDERYPAPPTPDDPNEPTPPWPAGAQLTWRGECVDAEELASAIRRAASLADIGDCPYPGFFLDFGEEYPTSLHVVGTEGAALVAQRLDRYGGPPDRPLVGDVVVPHGDWRVWVGALTGSAKASATARVGIVGYTRQEAAEVRRKAHEGNNTGTAVGCPGVGYFLLVTPGGYRFAVQVEDRRPPDWRHVIPASLDADNRPQGGWVVRVDSKELLDAIKRLSRRAKREWPGAASIALQVSVDPPTFRCVVVGRCDGTYTKEGKIPKPAAAVVLPYARVETRGGWANDHADKEARWALPISSNLLSLAVKGLAVERLRLDIPGQPITSMVLRPADDAASHRLLWLVMPVNG